MDITATTAPRSDQQNFDDYVSGPRTVTVSEVRAGSDEQPVEIHLVEYPGRPYKPSKSMRRLLAAAWGPETLAYHGRRMRLYGDPTVKFAGTALGGIKVSHLSHIDKPVPVMLTETRGKRSLHTVQPLPDEAPPPKPDLKQQVLARSKEIDAELTDDERKTWIRGELAALGGDTPDNLTKLLKSWEGK